LWGESTLSLSGLLDLHSHLLPGIDDGCRSLDESLACVRTLLEHGYAGTVCTPHMCVDAFPTITPANVAVWVAALRQELKRAGIDYRLWAGGEVRLAENTVAWFRVHGVPMLGESRCVLVDYWGRSWPEYCDPAIDYLLAEGYQPILAHPERMDFQDAEWNDVLERLQSRGVLLQGNLKCLAGCEGTLTHERSHRLLAARRYHLLATDMHGTRDLGERLAGLPAAGEVLGAAGLAAVVREHPAEILSHSAGRRKLPV
jgi:protein-tyrosine phosphatase